MLLRFSSYLIVFMLLLIYCSGVVFASTAKQAIIGGEASQIDNWPFITAIVRKGQSPFYGQFCAGSLIAPNAIVTAAHCLDDKLVSNIEVYIGASNLSKISVASERINVAKMIVHPHYNSVTNENDIALIFLTENANQPSINLLSSQQMQQLPNGALLTIAGWGNISTDIDAFPDELREVMVPLVSQSECNQAYSGDISPDMFCAGFKAGGKDSCSGDSGGPLVFELNGEPYLTGIVSWGNGCAEAGFYGVNVKVSHFSSWLESQINNHDIEFISAVTDQNLARCIEQTAQDNNWYRVNDFTYLNCPNQNITSLAGLEIYQQLSHLNLANNALINLAPLAKLTELTILNLANNRIEIIEALAPLSGLTSINLADNEIFCLFAYSRFNLHFNDIPAACWIDDSLDTDGDGIADMVELVLTTDINNADDFPHTVSQYKVDDIALQSCIEEQMLSGEVYTEQLTKLVCTEDDITSLRGLSLFKNLTLLDLSGQLLADVAELKTLIKLQTLNLSQNQISSLDFLNHLPALKVLHVQDNPIIDSQGLMTAAPNLTTLSASANLIQLNITPAFNLLTHLFLYQANDTSLSDVMPFTQPYSLLRLTLIDSILTDLTAISANTTLRSLAVKNSEISDLSALLGLPLLNFLAIENSMAIDFNVFSQLPETLILSLYQNNSENCLGDTQNYFASIAELPRSCSEAEPEKAQLATVNSVNSKSSSSSGGGSILALLYIIVARLSIKVGYKV